jgi:hypothetical protein
LNKRGVQRAVNCTAVHVQRCTTALRVYVNRIRVQLHVYIQLYFRKYSKYHTKICSYVLYCRATFEGTKVLSYERRYVHVQVRCTRRPTTYFQQSFSIYLLFAFFFRPVQPCSGRQFEPICGAEGVVQYPSVKVVCTFLLSERASTLHRG